VVSLSIVLCLIAPADLPSIADATKGLTKKDGLIESFVDSSKGRVLLKFGRPNDDSGTVGEYLYADSLASGLGANAIGLDRGEDGSSYVLRFRVRGEKLVVEAINTAYRANTANLDEQRATERSFPTSVLWAGPLTGRDPDGTCVVDFTSFVVRDAHRSGDTLGAYSLDAARSFLMPESCLAFPDNLEFDAQLTFQSPKPSPGVGEVSPDARSVTLIQHHSLVRLPDGNFKPRELDVRSGFFGMTVFDFAAPLASSPIKKLIARHRLEKTDPTKALSPVKKPIVYYLDRGAPEPVRSALLEGARWWSAAFEAAGFQDAFKVEVLPEDANPLDIRYNVIQWIHRSTRGYSVGGSITDPRTGEIVKGMVRLDSSRIRQDLLIFEGLTGAGDALTGKPGDMTVPGLARIRQLAAHEVGHTLGLKHNFAGSTWGGRASVMDYPGPKIGLNPDGSLDFSDAYGVGIGAWDKLAIWAGYSDSTEAERNKRLAAIHTGEAVYLTDEDDPPMGGADWRSSRWDNGNDPIVGLKNTLAIRRAALTKFGSNHMRPGLPMSQLELSLGPVYFFHRYDLGTLAKTLGGLQYEHSVNLDKPRPVRSVPGAQQRQALDLILDCVSPSFLDLPPSLASMLNPPAPGYGDSREKFSSGTRYAFDSLGAANTAADLVFSEILYPSRCTRIVEMHARDESLPSLEEVLARTSERVFGVVPTGKRQAEIARGVQSVYVDRLMDLVDADVPRSTRSRALAELMAVVDKAKARSQIGSPESLAHYRLLASEIQKFLDRPMGEGKRSAKPLAPMPGSPIGCSMG